VNDILLTLQVNGSAFPTCYSMTVITSNMTVSCTTGGSGSCTINQGTGSYADDTNIFITIEKSCGTTSVESASYTVTGHL